MQATGIESAPWSRPGFGRGIASTPAMKPLGQRSRPLATLFGSVLYRSGARSATLPSTFKSLRPRWYHTQHPDRLAT